MHIVNPELLKMAAARVKRAFVPGGAGGAPPMDPSMMGMPPGGGMPPMDPSMMGMPPGGGMPPMDPSMMGMPPGGGMPPMDPSMMGGGSPFPAPPPPDGGMGGGGGGMPNGNINQIIEDAVRKTLSGGTQGAGGAGGALKPKVDVNVTLLQILKILARICDALGVVIPASEMVATQTDLTQFAQQQNQQSAGGGSGIQPIQPFGEKQSSARFENGRPYDPSQMIGLNQRASALSQILRSTRNG